MEKEQRHQGYWFRGDCFSEAAGVQGRGGRRYSGQDPGIEPKSKAGSPASKSQVIFYLSVLALKPGKYPSGEGRRQESLGSGDTHLRGKVASLPWGILLPLTEFNPMGRGA